MEQIEQFISIFNNREKAVIVYAIGVIVALLFSRKMRKSIWEILKMIFTTKILFAILFSLVFYTFSMVYVLNQINMFSLSLLPTAMFWFFGEGMVLLFNANELDKQDKPFRKLFKDVLRVTLFVEFTANFYVFSFWGEMLFLLVIFFVVMITSFSSLKPEYAQIKKIFETISVILGLCILGYFVYRLFYSFSSFASWSSAKGFVLPIILSIGLFPLIYLILLIIKYDELFIRFRRKYDKDFDFPRKARWLIRKEFGVNYFALRSFLKQGRPRTFINYERLERAVKDYKNQSISE